MIGDNEIIELIKKAEEDLVLDYKQDLPLQSDGDKAEFVKDVIALANSGGIAYIIIGVEDGTGRPVGLKTLHTAEQMNQILKDKCDPPISVEYVERSILGYKIGVIEIKGENPPYVVSVPDKLGGPLSANPQKQFYIERGTVFIRNYNINEGAKRADLDKIYNKIKYVALQADLELSHEVTSEPSDNLTKVDIKFFLRNLGDVIATDTYAWMQFTNVKEIVQCKGDWKDISSVNVNIPTIQLILTMPVIRPIRIRCGGVVVKVDSGVEQIEARLITGATNMRTKEGSYVIPLKRRKKD
jgi:ribosomal protein L7Ae-like RNA K-turn-binding protein